MTSSPSDPIRPIMGVAGDRTITSSPIERVHRRERHDEDADDSGRRRRQQQAQHGPSDLEPSLTWDETAPDEVVTTAYDDHGRLARQRALHAEVQRARHSHFDARA